MASKNFFNKDIFLLKDAGKAVVGFDAVATKERAERAPDLKIGIYLKYYKRFMNFKKI